MKRIILLFALSATIAAVAVSTSPASGHKDEASAPIVGIKIPSGYRDWRLISVAREEDNLNDIRAILGNAIKAYRDGNLPFPDGTIIARLAFHQRRTTRSSGVRSHTCPGPLRSGICS